MRLEHKQIIFSFLGTQLLFLVHNALYIFKLLYITFPVTMSVKDRTTEFHAAVETIRSRSARSLHNTSDTRPLISSPPISHGNTYQGKHAARAHSEFALMASQIGKDINATTAKLANLTKLAKRKTLFDDKPVEIGELTYTIKQDIGKLNRQIADLQEHVRATRAPSKQASEHSNNVVVLLQSKLASTSMNFKDVLEIRTQNMKASKDRRDQFMFSTTEQTRPSSITNSPLLNPERRPVSLGNGSGTSSPVPMESPMNLGIPMISASQQQQQLTIQQQDQYIENRSSAIESIEQTIAELGSIFQQLAQMVAEQRETVQRIDQNTDSIESNVSSAQKELLKYYTNISNNRWLMLKIFATIIFFVLVFTVIS